MTRQLWLAVGLAACNEYDLKGPEDAALPASTASGQTTTGPSCGLAPPATYTVPSDPDCAQPPIVGAFDPVTEWTWTTNPVNPGFDQIMAAPVVANLTDDDGDGDIDRHDIPDVVFTSFSGGAYTSAGALTAISGADGGTIWSVVDAGGWQPYSTGGIAIGDLQGDGVPEVVVASPGGLLCVDAAGAFEWGAAVPPSVFGMPAIADLEGDGVAEVVFGATVVDHDGAVRFTGAGGTGGSYPASFAVDLDGDGPLEIVAGNTVYESTGAVRWNDGLPDGWPAVADFDGDGAPEIVRVWGSTVHLADTDGTPLWDFALTDGGGGPPTIADFDGDGEPEVGVASRSVYRVIDTDGTELWENVVQDFSSSITGSSVFDFEGDGAAEVVYADEETLWVYDGATGAVELQWDSHSSGTLLEYPVIVDVDQDGAAEIVVASNDYAIPGSHGITVIGDRTSSWAPARPIWNQHAYHITNVDDDGRIPAVQAANWATWNSFRAGNSETAVGLALPDWRVGPADSCLLECGEGRAWAFFPVQNLGAADGGAVTLVASKADAGTETELVALDVGVVPAGQAVWAGPLEVEAADFGSDGLVLEVVGGTECDATDDRWTWSAWPCP